VHQHNVLSDSVGVLRSQSMNHEFTRSQLYELVWSQPLRRIAKTLGVSDVAVAKRCRAAGIPLPGLGYWAKKEAGKPVIQAALPARGLGQSDEITIGPRERYGRRYSEEELIELTVPPPPAFEDDLDAVRARAEAIAARARPSSLARLHPVTAKLLEEDEIRREKHAKWSWYVPIFDAPQEKRRLRLINSLCNALASCGYKCTMQGGDGYQLSAHVGDQHVGFSLAPKGYDRQKHYPGVLVPNDGKLTLQLSWHEVPGDQVSRWVDEQELTLEKRLPEIVAGLLVAAEWAHRENLNRHHSWLVERKAQAIEERRQRREAEAKQERDRIDLAARKRREALLHDVKSWRTALEVREYVKARLACHEVTDDLRGWVDWALAEADRIDPLKQEVSPG
jgi:hypothetical protein